ncbi:MAG TPA: MFS transporter [Candidatus Binatia bacterium]|nr:MFS transporter [Candidatus Binatia bacterium]
MVKAKITGKARTVAVSVLFLASIMDLLDSTVVNIAIPAIHENLHASASDIQWIIAGYSLSFALLLITAGRLGDIYGYKKIFMIGVAGFTLLSLASGLAPTARWLIVTRLLQGAMAALMVPQVTSFFQIIYKPEERARLLGTFGAIGGMAAALGPIVGGLIIAGNWWGLSWRPIFLINIPIGLAVLAVSPKLLPSDKSSHPLKVDLPGTLLVTLALGFLVYPLIEGRELGWPHWIYLMMLASVPLFVLFTWYELRRERRGLSTLIVPELFKIRSFASGWSINILSEIAMAGVILISTLTLQLGFGFSALRAALTTLPIIAGLILSMTVLLNRLIKLLGRYVLILGCAGAILGYLVVAWTFWHYGASLAGWQLAPGLFVAGVGLGLVLGPLFVVTLQDVDTAHAGSASGLTEITAQLGGAIGVALIGTIFFNRLVVAGGSTQHAYTSAFIYGLILIIGLFVLAAALSFAAPRHFKTEDDLKLESA